MRLLGANRRPRMTGETPLPGRSHYFVGSDPAKWRRDVPQYARVRSEAVYPGIDVVYYGSREGELEYDFVVAPGADPSAIRLGFSGARRVELDRRGDLLLYTAAGTIRQRRPVAYQEIEGRRRPVAASYALVRPAGPGLKSRSDAAKPAFASSDRGVRAGGLRTVRPGFQSRVRFELGEYDRARPLVIDPVIVYSTYLGGSGRDHGHGVGVDATGNMYLGGNTDSPDFPVTPGAADPTLSGRQNFFAAKLDPTGSTLLHSTYIGGSEVDILRSSTVHPSGAATLVGDTMSTNFPTVNPIQAQSGGAFDSVICRLSPDGSALQFSTYLGGNDLDTPIGVAVDAAGSTYLAGVTLSTNFPTAFPLQAALNADGIDAYVAKLNPSGTALVYSTYLGGTNAGQEQGISIAVDPAGNAYVGVQTEATDFPTTPGAFDRTFNGIFDCTIAKLNSSGSSLVYSTYLGGGNSDGGPGVAVDATGQATVTGFTTSVNFPTVNAIQSTPGGNVDAFVTRLSADGGGLVFSTYLGGSELDRALGLGLGPDGSAWITGDTRSPNFPTANPTQPTYGGGQRDGFITRLNPAGIALTYSTYLGGSGGEQSNGVAFDSTGDAYVSGGTQSADFPTVSPYQAVLRGTDDAFLVKIQTEPPPPPAAPSGLTARAVGSRQVDLAWTDGSDDETGFRIERREGTGAFAAVGNVGAGVAAYSDTSAEPNRGYTYRALAVNLGGDSAPSNPATAATLGAPAGLAATALTAREIRLTWQDGSAGEQGLEIWRSSGAGFVLHAGVGPNQTSFLDQNLQGSTLYFYQARAVAQNSDSDFSNVASARTLPDPPTAPSDLAAVAASASTINLYWRDNSGDEDDFMVERSTDGGNSWAAHSTLPPNTTTYPDLGLDAGRTYRYRLKARNAGGESAASNAANATTFPGAPPAPSNLQAEGISTSAIRLTWQDNSASELAFRIERKQGAGSFLLVAEIGADQTGYTDAGRESGILHTYRVRAQNASGPSAWSNEAAARALPLPPAAPAGLEAAAISSGQILLTWTDRSNSEQGFRAERSEDGGATWDQAADLPADSHRWVDMSVAGGRSYQYRLKAWNAGGESGYSNVASANTPAGVALASLTVSPGAVRGGRSATGPLTLTGAAPGGGLAVALASSHAAACVPGSVTVPAGKTTATFPVSTARVRRNTRVTLTAIHGGEKKTATLTVRR